MFIKGGESLYKKRLNFILVGVLLFALIWTIYSNLFQVEKTSNQTIAIGSHEIELAEDSNSEITEHDQIENNDQEDNEPHNHEEHEHDANLIENHYTHDGHLHEEYTTEVVNMNKSAHAFITKTLDGETVQLSDFLGKKVILNFWTTWCPPCQEEVPELQKFYEETMNHDEVVLLGLNITKDDLGIDVIHQFREYYGITYPILLDENREITDKYEILTIPTTYIIDENGNLEKQIIGPLTNDMLIKLMKE